MLTKPSIIFHKAIEIVRAVPQQPVKVLQRRLINALLQKAVISEPVQGWYEFNCTSLAFEVGYKSLNQLHFFDSVTLLMHLEFDWNEISKNCNEGLDAFILFPRMRIVNGILKYQIMATLISILKAPTRTVALDLNVGRSFSRSGTNWVWEFVLSYEKDGITPPMLWQRFRKFLVGNDKSYQDYKTFKQKVLLPSIVEFNNKSEHLIRLKEVISGLRVTEIQFIISAKKYQNNFELYNKILLIGIPMSEAINLINLYSNDLLHVILSEIAHIDQNQAINFRKKLNLNKIPASLVLRSAFQ